MPAVAAGLQVGGDDGGQEEIVAAFAWRALRRLPGGAVADSEEDQAGIRVIDDAVPGAAPAPGLPPGAGPGLGGHGHGVVLEALGRVARDRKSTRLNSSH